MLLNLLTVRQLYILSFAWISSLPLREFKKGMLPQNPRPLKCSIGRRDGTDYGLPARYHQFKEYIPILSCKRDIQVHLQHLNVSSSSVSSESELILLRAGYFEEQGEGMTVCPKNRDILGLSWRPSRYCAHPLHPSTKGKCGRGVSKKMCLEIMNRWDKLVRVGSGKV